MSRCARCDYNGDNLPQHAEEADHPICCVCNRRSLTTQERQTCATCIGRVRADLADIENFYARLEGVLVENRYPALAPDDRPHGGDDETAIPGGDALVMVSGGGNGSPAGRRVAGNEKADLAFDYPEFAKHPAYRRGETNVLPGREHVADELTSYPPSVAALLAVHEDDWRRLLGHEAAGPADVAGSVAYLTSQLDRIAQTYSEFDSFAVDIQKMRQRLQSTVGFSEQPVRGAPCFDCGQKLVRRYRYPGDRYEPPASQPGLEEAWSCTSCGRVYEQAEYWLAVRAALEAQQAAS